MSKEQIKDLENNIALYNMTLKRMKDDDNTIYLKGVTYLKLFNITKDLNHGQEALKCLDKAVALTNSQNRLYLAERSKAHAKMGNNDLAVADLAAISALPKVSDGDETIEDIYTRNTVNNIAKLEGIRNIVKSLKVKGKISPELAKVLDEHAKITSDLVVQVDEQHGRLNNIDDKIVFLEGIIRKLQSDMQLSSSEIERLNIDNEANKEAIKEHSLAIESMRAQMEEFARSLNLTNEQLTILEQELEEYGIDNESIREILPLVSRIKLVVQEQELADLSKKNLAEIMDDPYKASFYSAVTKNLNSTYLATEVIGTGMVKNNKSGIVGNIGNVLQVTGSYVPVFGVGVQILGFLLSCVDDHRESVFAANYRSIADSAGEMHEIADRVGRSLVDGSFDRAILDGEGTIQEKLTKFFKSLADMTCSFSSGSGHEDTGKMLTKCKDKIKKSFGFFASNSEDHTTEMKGVEESVNDTVLGEMHGNLISSLIIKKMFETSLEGRPSLEAKVDRLIGFINETSLEVRYIESITYDNIIVSDKELLFEACKMGSKVTNKLLSFGDDRDLAESILEASREYGANHVINMIFDSSERESSGEEALALDVVNAVCMGNINNDMVMEL